MYDKNQVTDASRQLIDATIQNIDDQVKTMSNITAVDNDTTATNKGF